MLAASGLGRTGPYRTYVGYVRGIHACSGLCYLTGHSGGPPVQGGGVYADYLTGTTSAFAILAALHHRSKTGEGQYIDIAMSESVMAQLPEAIMDYTMNGRVRSRVGNRDDIMAPHGCYPCRGEDKWVAIAVSTEEEWAAFCQAIGSPQWTKEEKFSDGFSRWRNQDELDKLIAGWTMNHTHYEVMQILQKAGVAAGPSVSMEELINDAHLGERGFFVETDHPEVGRRSMVGLPWKTSTCPDYQSAPLLGQHNEYVFMELLGMPDSEFVRLVDERVIY